MAFTKPRRSRGKRSETIALAVGPGTGRDLAATIAAAPKVRNALPQGATWNGVEDQYAGDPRFAKPEQPESAQASSGQ